MHLTARDDACDSGNEFDGQMPLRIASVFVILVGGTAGAVFPLLSSKHSFIRMPPMAFFFAKYFGSGVITATAFVHLLMPSYNALTAPCLGDTWSAFPFSYGICLVFIYITLLMDVVIRWRRFRLGMQRDGESGLCAQSPATAVPSSQQDVDVSHTEIEEINVAPHGEEDGHGTKTSMEVTYTAKSSRSGSISEASYSEDASSLAAQISSIMFLEFGILFHSVFVGLTLAVTGEEFNTLFAVMIFHQTFEGLGLGTRIAMCKWPKNKLYVPWVLTIAFGLTTPVAIAIGLGLRNVYGPTSRTGLITEGIFDAASAGILIYSGMVDLMGNEFLHCPEMTTVPLWRRLLGLGFMFAGTALMSMLAIWDKT